VFPVALYKHEGRVNHNFPVVLHEFESWPLTLGEEHRLRVFKNRVLRKIFGPKREEVTGGWRKA
jgi:hypothetical protein